MTPTPASQRDLRRGRTRAGALLLVTLGLFVAPAVSGCAGPAADPTWTHTPMAVTPTAPADAATTARAAAWAARPDFVRADARTEAAYAYAMAAPGILRWMPCYCGCGAMGHGSNADCFFKPTMAGLSSLTFEEHASYCGICVDTALMVQQLSAEGQSLQAIRAAVDARFGGAAPGTPTDLPPA
jgi:hypothetical protein